MFIWSTDQKPPPDFLYYYLGPLRIETVRVVEVRTEINNINNCKINAKKNQKADTYITKNTSNAATFPPTKTKK